MRNCLDVHVLVVGTLEADVDGKSATEASASTAVFDVLCTDDDQLRPRLFDRESLHRSRIVECILRLVCTPHDTVAGARRRDRVAGPGQEVLSSPAIEWDDFGAVI